MSPSDETVLRETLHRYAVLISLRGKGYYCTVALIVTLSDGLSETRLVSV